MSAATVATAGRTYLLIGHVTRDLTPAGDWLAGGTVTFAAALVRALGWRPVIITAAGPDFAPPAHLADVEWHVLPSPATTAFRNEYGPRGRRQTIGPIAVPISARELAVKRWDAAVVHLAPVAQEVSPSVLSLFSESRVMATPQGWMRRWSADGTVAAGHWQAARGMLPRLEAAVLSIEDLAGDWQVAARWAKSVPLLVVTEAHEGCSVFHRGRRVVVPARPCRVADPTGAGDLFAAAFFIRLRETADPIAAARFANVAASMTIELPGREAVACRRGVERELAAISRRKALPHRGTLQKHAAMNAA